ncbi:adenosylmethionine decarboxylase [Paenibacillus shunpengii]|uniref:S-adenosylmethionine decarboxylase proenzyme n=2 Tax=Paenibacillus TaxID=44249 RepID=A0AAX3MX45_9BACL|nr:MULTISPECIES: adenosylmethionine decarboxylase [Paenibacillus]OMC64923.1 S-adenosylmethionine decarboxylase proenzyme [Paenibacillus sp. FSL H7-0326]WDH81827.1 adenosylmethionine decarboxylase [Paenibacillus urinalis]SDX52459.1 adenosylmethionine decarboxylase proenzyme [Paenibacillus sp. PDC88]
MGSTTFGRHVAVDTWGVDFDLLNNEDYLQVQMVEAAEACDATILSVQSRQFEPHGVTVLVMLAESHLSIHTHPERGFAAIDCYTCGELVDPQLAVEYLVSALNPEKIFSKTLVRGNGELDVEQPVKQQIELV